MRPPAAILFLAVPAQLVASGVPPQGFRLPSGLAVAVQTDVLRPLVRITLRLDLPAELAEADLRMLGAALARGGAGPHSAQDLQRSGMADGHAWTFEIRGRSLSWSVLADSQDQEGAAEHLAHRVVRPDLTEGWRNLRMEAAETSGRAAFRAALTQDPVHWNLPEDATLERLLALGRALLRPERATLSFQGDVTLAQARQLALLQFGTWRPGPPDALPDPVPRLAGPRITLAPGSEGRTLQAGLERASGPEGLQASVDILMAHRLAGLFDRREGCLVHAHTLRPSEGFSQALQALLAEVDRRLAVPPGAEDLRILRETRAAALLRQRLEPALAHHALPEDLPLERLAPLLEAAAVRKRLRVLLEGAGSEDQTALAALALGPVQRFNR